MRSQRGHFRGSYRKQASARRAGGGGRKPVANVSSRRTPGLFTRGGTQIRNVKAYTNAGGKAYNHIARQIKHPQAYASKVQDNSINAAAKRVMKQNPNAKAASYVIKDADSRRRYAGSTTNPVQRMNAHLSGRGAEATKQMNSGQVTFTAHRTPAAAKKNETKLYYQEKQKHGIDNVRGAGHTTRFSFS